MIGALIARDIKLAWRSGGAWLLGVMFFVLFITFCVIAVGAAARTGCSALGPGFIWLALLFATLLSFGDIFQRGFGRRHARAINTGGDVAISH